MTRLRTLTTLPSYNAGQRLVCVADNINTHELNEYVVPTKV